jgi:hypothetical protein
MSMTELLKLSLPLLGVVGLTTLSILFAQGLSLLLDVG